MFNNRKFINELIKENEKLKIDIESKENQILNVLDSNKELSQHNNYLESKNMILKRTNRRLNEIIKKHEENECRLNTELCRAEGQLNKLDNYIKMTTGMSLLDREDIE